MVFILHSSRRRSVHFLRSPLIQISFEDNLLLLYASAFFRVSLICTSSCSLFGGLESWARNIFFHIRLYFIIFGLLPCQFLWTLAFIYDSKLSPKHTCREVWTMNNLWDKTIAHLCELDLFGPWYASSTCFKADFMMSRFHLDVRLCKPLSLWFTVVCHILT